MKTFERIINVFDQNKEQPAVISNGISFTYTEVKNVIIRLAGLMHESGVTKDDRVLILSSSKYHCLIGIYATIYAGAIAVPLSPDTAADKLTGISTLVDASLVLCDDPALIESTSLNSLSLSDAPLSHSDFKPIEQSGNDSALILLTSGTSGDPKATALTHSNLISTSLYINEFMEVDTKLAEYICIPIHHSFGFARTRCIFLSGGTIIFDDGLFHPLLATRQMTRYQANAFSGVPAIIAMLVKFAKPKFDDLAGLIKYVEIGSAPMAEEHKLFLLNHLPDANICMHYGLTEASRACFINFRDERDKLSSIGRPSPGVAIKILGKSNKDLPNGEIGEIVIKGPNVASGYYNDPVLTAEKFVNGWFHTGDSGYRDDSGYIYFLGRQDELINYGGRKISPTEIERSIMLVDKKLQKFCVIGIPDLLGIQGEIPALVVENPAFANNEFNDLVSRLIENKIPDHYLPRKYFAVDHIPRTHNGKIRRKELLIKLKIDS